MTKIRPKHIFSWKVQTVAQMQSLNLLTFRTVLYWDMFQEASLKSDCNHFFQMPFLVSRSGKIVTVYNTYFSLSSILHAIFTISPFYHADSKSGEFTHCLPLDTSPIHNTHSILFLVKKCSCSKNHIFDVLVPPQLRTEKSLLYCVSTAPEVLAISCWKPLYLCLSPSSRRLMYVLYEFTKK